MLRPTTILAIMLLVPVALASSSTWTDASGDVEMRIVGKQEPPPGLTCTDERVDITSVVATSDEDWITFEVTFMDLAHAPGCVVDATGTPVALTAGRQDLALEFGVPWANPGILFDAYGLTSCDAEYWIGDHFGQPLCEVEIGGDTVTVRTPTFTWAIDQRTGEYIERFDLRTLEWPAGRAVSWTADRIATTDVTVIASDELDIGSYDP